MYVCSLSMSKHILTTPVFNWDFLHNKNKKCFFFLYNTLNNRNHTQLHALTNRQHNRPILKVHLEVF